MEFTELRRKLILKEFSRMNDVQKRAVFNINGATLILAGAGSGKTAVLSERILDYCLKGNDIRDVLVLTFTNAAALEMKERIKIYENQYIQEVEVNKLTVRPYLLFFDDMTRDIQNWKNRALSDYDDKKSVRIK